MPFDLTETRPNPLGVGPFGMVDGHLVAEILLHLDEDSGRLYWRPRPLNWFQPPSLGISWNARCANQEAFAIRSADGYLRGTLINKKLLAHRVVFAVANKRWPIGIVDHRDGDRLNNRPSNLREATYSQNAANAASRPKSRSQYRGVSWSTSLQRWASRCKLNGREHFIGYFDTEVEAARAYDMTAVRVHGEFARTNFPAGENDNALR